MFKNLNELIFRASSFIAAMLTKHKSFKNFKSGCESHEVKRFVNT